MLLLHGEVQLLAQAAGLLLEGVGDVAVLGLLGQAQVLHLLQQREVAGVLGHALLDLVELGHGLVVLALLDRVLGVLEDPLDELLLLLDEAPHRRHVLAVDLLGGVVGGAGDDERGAGLVDEDRVDLVDDREVVLALHHLRGAVGHVVAQVVEAELAVGPVGDVLAVLLAALVRFHAALDAAHAEPEVLVEHTHPMGVAAGEVVVDRHHVHALAGERVEVGGQGRDKGLAFASGHLRDAALVHRDAADELDVVGDLHPGPLAAHQVEGRSLEATAGVLGCREGLHQQVVDRLAVLKALLELGRLAAQLVVGERLVLLLEGVDLIDQRADLLEVPLVLGAEDFLDEPLHGIRISNVQVS